VSYGHESGRQTSNRDSVVVIGDGANVDGFSRLRTSNPVTVFDSTFRYNLQPLVWQTVTANGATITHSAPNASAIMTLDGTAGGSAILQTRQYFPYVPGKSQLILMTGVAGAAVAGVTKRGGYYDNNDGVFWEQASDGTIYAVERTSTSGSPSDSNKVASSDWNLDKMDGTGPSGFTFDVTKSYIAVIDLQWLGMGRVRFGFDINGQIIYCHEFRNANNLSTVYMRTGSLPVRWEISGNVAASMQCTCCAVVSEGGADKFLGYNFGYARSAGVNAASGAQTLAFNFRPKSTFNSITNRFYIEIEDVFCAVGGNYPVLVEVYHNTTVGGAPSWADSDATYSGAQFDTAGTPSGGVRIMSFVVAAGATSKGTGSRLVSARYPITMDYAGTGYTNVTVYVTGLGGASLCYPGMNWEEVR